METLVQAVTIYSEDIGKEISIENYAMRIMKIGKWQMKEGIELPNQEKNRTIAKKAKLQILKNTGSGHQ